jgi:L-fucose mutarotase
MLKNIPKSFTPDLLSLLMSMGHGEQVLISDANYPSLTNSGSDREGLARRIYLPLPSIAELLREILRFFPLDYSVEEPALVMASARELAPGQEVSAYDQYAAIIREAGETGRLGTVERFDFYKAAAGAAGIVVTGDTIKGGNILLKKGVVR